MDCKNRCVPWSECGQKQKNRKVLSIKALRFLIADILLDIRWVLIKALSESVGEGPPRFCKHCFWAFSDYSHSLFWNTFLLGSLWVSYFYYLYFCTFANSSSHLILSLKPKCNRKHVLQPHMFNLQHLLHRAY